MRRRRRHTEEPHRGSSRGAHLIRANFARGACAATPTGRYITDRAKDKPNTLQGTRR